MTYHIVILYDSITNSVFESQVLKPLQTIRATKKIVLISFEYPWHRSRYQRLLPSIPQEYNVHILYKMPLLGLSTLWYAQGQLRRILTSYKDYCLVARGQIAGYLCIKSGTISPLTIQIRGLLAQEYNFVHYPAQGWARWWYALKQQRYQAIEDYCIQQAPPTSVFEFVSAALKEYYHEYYRSPSISTAVAQQDIPLRIDSSLIKTWRQEIRTALAIEPDAQVYCYNGSAKPWQCADQAITYFKQQLRAHPCYLLILTPDIKTFQEKLQTHHVEPHFYRLLQVNHELIYQYLASADYGLIFRDPHPINWTSRPTKVLEYQAVGLPIIHNNTIGMLCS